MQLKICKVKFDYKYNALVTGLLYQSLIGVFIKIKKDNKGECLRTLVLRDK